LPPLLVPLSADLSALRSLFSPPPFSTPHRLTLEGNERLKIHLKPPNKTSERQSKKQKKWGKKGRLWRTLKKKNGAEKWSAKGTI
jgi:hypothetical protein